VRFALPLLALTLLTGCDPYGDWPEEGTYFPYVYTPETDLEPYEEVRWETESWDPAEDLQQAGQYLLKLQHHRPGAPLESIEHFDAHRPTLPALGAGVRLNFVGDVMWLGENWSEFALPVADLLDGDLRIGNLETPTSPDHPTAQEDLDLYTFNAPPEVLDSLPLDVVQLNNNHSVDIGEDGLEATIVEVEARGLQHTGVDGHATVEVGGLRIALLSYEVVPGIGTCSIRTDDGRERTAAILYSLGNFDTMQPTVPVQTGLVATVSLDPDVTGLGWEAISTVRIDGLRTVVPLDEIAATSNEHEAERRRLEFHLGTSWRR